MFISDSDSDLHYWDGTAVERQGGKVRAITVTTGGTGYTSATAIITGPTLGGTMPELITLVAGGAVTGVTVVNGGSGYITAPTVTIIGNGSGATATATVSAPPAGIRIWSTLKTDYLALALVQTETRFMPLTSLILQYGHRPTASLSTAMTEIRLRLLCLTTRIG